ncbi:MAG: hypothetical protein WCR28_06710 [Candidatus Izemoplasmatales bacterium]|nr:hypothetical protein [Candidatus Izemoplasmatales bacterium]MDY0372899.1 hypothetical protein [Candidatus Izemoplasmatales bacterium]
MKKRLMFFLFFFMFVGLLGCEGMTLPSGFTLPTTEPVSTISSTTELDTSATVVPTTAAPTSGIETTLVPTTTVPLSGTDTTTIPTSGSAETTQPTSATSTTVSTTVPVTTAMTTTAPATTVPTTSNPTTTVPTTTAPTTTTPTTQSTTIPITTTTETPTTTTTVSSYVVIFMADGEVHQQSTVVSGGQITEPEAPVVADKLFIGWYLPGSEVAATFPVTVTEALTFTARFEDIVTEKENHFFLRIKNQTATTLEVEVVLGGNPLKINGYDLQVTYEVAKLQYVSFDNNLSNTVNPDIPGVINFVYSNALSAITTETVLLTIHYNIIQTAETDIGITINEAYFVDAQYDPIIAISNLTGVSVTLQ